MISVSLWDPLCLTMDVANKDQHMMKWLKSSKKKRKFRLDQWFNWSSQMKPWIQWLCHHISNQNASNDKAEDDGYQLQLDVCPVSRILHRRHHHHRVSSFLWVNCLLCLFVREQFVSATQFLNWKWWKPENRLANFMESWFAVTVTLKRQNYVHNLRRVWWLVFLVTLEHWTERKNLWNLIC